jgi:hypothetical protein
MAVGNVLRCAFKSNELDAGFAFNIVVTGEALIGNLHSEAHDVFLSRLLLSLPDCLMDLAFDAHLATSPHPLLSALA